MVMYVDQPCANRSGKTVAEVAILQGRPHLYRLPQARLETFVGNIQPPDFEHRCWKSLVGQKLIATHNIHLTKM